MARWYQNVLTGEQVEVHTLDEDDFYVGNAANWSRIAAPSPTEAVKASEAGAALAHHKAEEKDASEAGRDLQARKTTKKKA